MATGSGKMATAALIIASFNKSTIFYVIGKDLLHQSHKMLSKVFDQKIGIVGDGLCDIQDINVVSVWTLGHALGMNFRMDQNVQSHTVGALGGVGISNCATAQTGANIITNNWTSSVTNLLLPGDVVTFANVYAVNPVSFQSTGSLKQFVVTSAVSSSGGSATIPISPAIVTSGPYQNVTAGVAQSSAVLTFAAASTYANTVTPVNVAYHRDAFCLGMADLGLPGGVEMAARASDPRAGMSLRVVRAYDIVNDQHPCRIDVLYGWQTIYQELACRIQG
jgi:hypothetical protein